MFKFLLKKRSGFTLAEVLITLGIIGVIAALTIPTLILKSDERAHIVALKKAYSVLTSAYKLAENDNGTPDNWGLATQENLLAALLPYLKINKNCLDGSKGCWPTSVDYKYLATSYGGSGIYDDAAGPKLQLADGTLIYGLLYSTDCSTPLGTSLALQNGCAIYYIDVNGFKSPNQWGKDTFMFYLTKYGIVPCGTPQETSMRFLGDCKDINNANGMPCTAWVLFNDNMDYLHCSDLGWDSKTTCN